MEMHNELAKLKEIVGELYLEKKMMEKIIQDKDELLKKLQSEQK